jgi:aminocarboxymuconate-semialdehyde decarboxylase
LIDVHAHAVLPGVMGCAGEYGPELGVGPEGRPRFRAGNYILDGVDYTGTPFMDVDVRLAADFCRWHNDEMAKVVGAHPDRLRGFAQLPMQDIGASVAELRRAVTDLGLVGAYIGTDFGTDFDDERLDPFWAAAVDLDVPVFIHPAPWGIDGPLRDERIRKYDLDLSVGFMFEETIAMACLVYGGVLDRHPDLDICLSHGGGACAYMLGRLEHQGRTRPWARERPVDFQGTMQKMWFDNHVHDDDSLWLLERKVGRDRLVVGTNLAGWDAPTERDQIPFVDAYDDNARRLLRLDR